MSKAIHSKLLEASKDLHYLKGIIERNGIVILKRQSDEKFFEHLCKTVVSQQLSNKAADTIWNRIITLSQSHKKPLFEIISLENADEIKACGLSRFKLKAIIGLQTAIAEKSISNEIFSTSEPELIIGEISKLWGFGRWSAEMAALFFFGSPDVWSDNDAALKRGINIISQKENIPPQTILNLMTPYRSYFSMHIWRGLDTQLIN